MPRLRVIPIAMDTTEIRITRISWIEPVPETLWLYEKLASITWNLNQQSYCFELSAVEKPQYTIYLADEGGTMIGTLITARSVVGANFHSLYSFLSQPTTKAANYRSMPQIE